LLRPSFLIGFAFAVGLGATVAVAAVPAVGAPYQSPSVHVAVETAASLISLLAAYLVFGRFQQNARLDELTLCCALAIFGATNLWFRTVPSAFTGAPVTEGFAQWAPLGGAVVGAGILALAAFARDVPISRPARQGVVALLLVLLTLGALAAIAVTRRPPSADSIAPSTSRPELLGDVQVSTMHLIAALLFVAAAVGFARRARTGDDFMRWLAGGAMLAAFSRVIAGLFPPLYFGWVHVGDLLRLGFYVFVLIGAAREISGYWVKFAEATILEERRRIARDLHDGLAQELAYVVGQAHQAARDGSGRAFEHLATVAQRALDDSRRAIAALAEPLDQPLAAALTRTVEEVVERTGVPIHLELDGEADVDAATREALLRIVREAVMNAARHGGARAISVRLSHDDRLLLEITDDGVGFDAAAAKRDRFGLITMNERAQALGGEFRIHTEPGAGTRVEVVLP
jgi:signal transduction histidine kinase